MPLYQTKAKRTALEDPLAEHAAHSSKANELSAADGSLSMPAGKQAALQLQRTLGNRATAQWLQRSAKPAADSASGMAIQRTVAIGDTVYDSGNMRTLLDLIGQEMSKSYPTAKAKRGPLQLIRSGGLYNFHTIHEVIDYMIADEEPALQPQQQERPAMTKSYGAEHGDLHFGGKPIAKKAKWTLEKGDALTLMEAEIDKHMDRLINESDTEGWTSWYIGGDAGDMIGNSVAGVVSTFCIQAQVNLQENTISYHGYPDQRLLKVGAGRSKSTIS